MNVLSGVQPSGDLHIGNYFGAIKQWLDIMSKPQTVTYFMIADLHAITVYQDPAELREKIYKLLALYLAMGLDYHKNVVFAQSQNPDHTYLAWLFDTITPIGWLERMTQFKDKKRKLEKYNSVVSAGLFNYPALMAADILLYDIDVVPVGEDQIQHVELTRDIAKRFNKLYGETFKVPVYQVNKSVARVMDLQNPKKKMSKSDGSNNPGCVFLLDDPDTIRKKIKRAVTDADREIKYDKENKPGVSNLLGIYSVASGKSIKELENMYSNKTYADFKSDLAEILIETLEPVRKKTTEFLNDKGELDRILAYGVQRARDVSSPLLKNVLNKMGFILNE